MFSSTSMTLISLNDERVSNVIGSFSGFFMQNIDIPTQGWKQFKYFEKRIDSFNFLSLNSIQFDLFVLFSTGMTSNLSY